MDSPLPLQRANTVCYVGDFSSLPDHLVSDSISQRNSEHIMVLNVIICFSTSFISKQEGPKTIVEGSGSVKVKDEQKSASVKYIRTVLTEGNEQGIEVHCCLFYNKYFY
jgi:hypothetical protein